MNAYECRIQEGSSYGKCALGFGVCCVCTYPIILIHFTFKIHNIKTIIKFSTYCDIS